MASSAVVKRATQNQAVSQAVVSAVAEFTGSDPISLDPLYNTVDPDALDALFDGGQMGSGRSPNRITFTHCGCDVVVTTAGAVQVTESVLASQESPSNATDNVRS